MRFFAATLVFVDHFGREAFTDWPLWFQELLTHGRSAVTFFFILSGFVLAYSYLDSNSKNGIRTTRKRFSWNRFARIYPIYFLALLPALLNKSFHIFQGSVDSQVLWGFPIAASLLQAWFPPWAGVWNPPAWSLSVEAFFYLAFPFVAIRLRSVRATTVLLWMVPLALAFAWLRITIQQTNDPLGAFFPLFHLPTFLLGYGIGRLLREQPAFFVPHRFSLMMVSAITFFIMAFGSYWLSPHAIAACLELLFALFIAVLSTVKGPVKHLLSNKLLVLLGEASYSLYITHMAAMIAFERIARKAGLWEQPKESILFVLVGFLACALLSVLLFKRVETPARRWLVGRSQSRAAGVPEAA